MEVEGDDYDNLSNDSLDDVSIHTFHYLTN